MSTPDFSRRVFLMGTSSVAAYAMLSPMLSRAAEIIPNPKVAPETASAIGRWSADHEGLPVFQYTARPFVPGASIRKSVTLEDDPYFLLGNYRFTSFVHSSGVVRIMTGERAWARLDDGLNARPDNHAKLIIKSAASESEIDLIGPNGIAREPQYCQREFGVGYASFRYLKNDMICHRTISVQPSRSVNEGIPAYLVGIRIENSGDEEREFTYDESILSRYAANVDLNTPESQWPTKYTYSVSQNKDAGLVTCASQAHPKDPSRYTASGHENRNDLSPPGIFMQAPRELNNGIDFSEYSTDADQSGKYIGISFTAKIPAGKSVDAYILIGIRNNGINDDYDSFMAEAAANRSTRTPFLSVWRAGLPDFSGEMDAGLRREMLWNAYVLEAMATYSEFYNETYIPQGMTYDYTNGVSAAPRDHLQHCLPLCYINPALAKSAIRFVMKKMTYQGEIKYTDLGYGRTSNSAWNTSDQQLYLFLAVSEYLRISNDFGFLEESTEFLPMEAKYSVSTLEKIRRAFSYLRDEVGVGPHRLIKLMNSDWNDMVYVETPVMEHYWTAESHMNSAMSLCVLPALIQQLETGLPKLRADNQVICRNLITGMGQFEKAMRDAFYKDLGERSFSRRLYLDAGDAMGDKDMYIEPQIFMIQDSGFPREKKEILWREIQDRLLRNERLGPREREHGVASVKYGPGTCENGGFWYSLTGPLVVGLAGFDRKAAADLLDRMTSRHFIKNYPDYWVGHWTAPDTLNTFESGDIAGLPRPGDNGLWFNFAAYCAHAHAWPLYAYLRLTKNDVVRA